MRVLKEFGLTTDGDLARRRAFSLQTRSVTALYERLFPRFKIQSCWKVLVNCVNANARPQYRDLLGVYEMDVEVDVPSFFRLSDAQKRAWTFEHLQLGIERLRQQTGWAEEPFATACAMVNEQELRNVWRWCVARSPSGQKTAEVWVDHDVQACLISLVVRSHTGHEVSRHELITELPDEWAFSPHLGSVTWASDACVLLTSKDGQHTWPVDLPPID
jgi:hypothetical protein